MEIEKAKGTDLIVDDMPDWMRDYKVEQEFETNELQFPNLIVAQTNSKALIKKHEAFIEGLQAGDFYNSLTRDIYGPSVKAIYCHKIVSFQVFKDEEFFKSLSQKEFLALNNRQFDKKKGATSIDLPGCFIKEVWRYIAVLPDYPEVPFIALNVKPGGIAEAKVWNSKMAMEAGRNVPYTGVVWSLPLKEKSSTVTDNVSYQLDGASIKKVRYATKKEMEQAESVRSMVRQSNLEQQIAKHEEPAHEASGDSDFE